MGFLESAVFYLVIGVAVAAAVLRSGGGSLPGLAFRAAGAVLFWPLYLPLLLSGARGGHPAPPDEPRDAMARSLSLVEGELAAALSSLDGWAEDVLLRERGRIEELKRSWKAQAARIREMDAVLEREGEDEPLSPPASAPAGSDSSERSRRSDDARRLNVQRLRSVRSQSLQDLMGTLAWVRELVSMIHLAKFTGAPASRAEELVAQVAAAVEGLSAVSEWGEESAKRL